MATGERAGPVAGGGAPPLALVGPTASGKSALALELARRHGLELVSVDSMQVYRGMDVGTAKPTPAERAEMSHHLIDLVDPWEEFGVAEFQSAYRTVAADVAARGAAPMLVGGTGLYLRAVTEALEIPGRFPDVRAALEADPDTEGLHRRLAELDPVAAARMEPNNRRRVVRALEVTLGSGRPFSSFGPGLMAYPEVPFRLVGLSVPWPELDERIAARLRLQVEAGFVEEVRRLAEHPSGLSRTAAQALGYRELLEHLRGSCSLEEAIDLAALRTRQFARRQQRWFRRDPRIEWIEAGAGQNPMGDLEPFVGG